MFVAITRYGQAIKHITLSLSEKYTKGGSTVCSLPRGYATQEVAFSSVAVTDFCSSLAPT